MLIETNTQKTLELLFKNPTAEYSIRDIARKTKTTPPTASGIIKRLEKEGLVKIHKTKRMYKVTADIENRKFQQLKRVYNLYSLQELQEKLIKEYNHPEAIIVYGSYNEGQDTEQSDIDIAVMTTKKIELRLKDIEQKLNRKVHLITISNLQSIPETLRINIINGTKLYGKIKC